jgi:chemotaxis protein methyltransferase CheR
VSAARASHAAALAELAALVRRETGNDLPEGRLDFLREAAERRARATGSADLAAYVQALGAGALKGEWELLASLVTIKESSFYRVPQQWERLRTTVLPELARRRAGSRRLRVWSAACAAGEEPATMALVLADAPQLAGWDWSILATDLDPEALAHAERGLYGARAVASVPPAQLAAGFRPRGGLWELDPQLRARIRYERLNLARPPWRLPEERFDVVLLRNVLIYFRAELQREVVGAVSRRLEPDGWLFLGGSETLWRVQDRLEPVDLGDCFAYRHAGAPAEPSAAPRRRRGPSEPVPGGPSRRASDRRLADSGAIAAVGPAPPAASGPSASDRILAAVGHLEADATAAAEREAAAALDADPADPAAHVLRGLLHDLAGRHDDAADDFRAALYLEPDLFQARLLLAGCLKRLGEPGLAERQYREVLATLERGAPRRLAALEGRLLPDPAQARDRARAALTPRRAG